MFSKKHRIRVNSAKRKKGVLISDFWLLQSSAKYSNICYPSVVSCSWWSSIIVPDSIYSNDIFRKTYNSDRFESVTKPASWSLLGSAGEDAIHVSL